MKPKTLTTIILVMIFLIGIIGIAATGFVSAEEYAGVLNNISEISINNFIAGDTASATFSFNYQDYYGNKEYPHILRINISSEDQTNYPVGKGDFELSGFVRKYTFFGLFHTDVNLECSEKSPLIIDHPLGLNTLNVPNGTFYCYNTTSEAIDQLDKYDQVFLNIKSHPALWPGEYTITAELFYIEDTKAPFVNILNKNAFETKYYRELSNIEVQATIRDINLENFWGTVFTPTQNITVPFSHKDDDIYYFTKILPIDIQEGNYELKIFAKDANENIGNDSTTLKIDRTGPNITAISPNGSIYEEIIPVELNVTDAKAGVNNQSVYYRLREMNGTSICPETGGPINGTGCITTPWISLTLNSTSGLFEVYVNTTEYNLTSGSYWLEARAEDILGNKAEWIV